MKESKRLVLDELRKAFSGVYAAGDILDGKLQNILNYSSVIISAVSAILTVASKTTVGRWYWVFLSLSIVLYCTMFVRVRLKLKPVLIAFPISSKMETLKKKYFDARFDEERVLDQAIFDYLYYIEAASKNNVLKAKEVNISSWFMFAIIISLIFTSLFGLVFPSL